MARIIGKAHAYDDVSLIPLYNKIASRKDVSFRTKVTRNHYIDLPFIAANMDTVCESDMAIAFGKMGGLGVIHRFNTIKQESAEVRKVKEKNLLCAAAVGVKDYQRRIESLVDSGVDILVIDISHGHSKYVGKTLDWAKKHYPKIDVMVGNIATKDAAHYFLTKGADAVKVGIGPGSMCTTRLMTGTGVPQITAIMDVYEETHGEIPSCADGGIRYPADCVKAIAAGANTVMVGSIISGTDETPGPIIRDNGEKFKIYRGMASFEATLKKLRLDGKTKKEIVSIEGEETRVPYRGPVRPILRKFLGGLASGMTFHGAKSIDDLCGKGDFVEVSSAGLREGEPHGLKK
jgi:IMP dehydrogenase